MAWLAILVVASAALIESDIDYTLLQRRHTAIAFPHYFKKT